MHALFSTLLLTALITLPTSAMEEPPRQSPINNQQAMKIIDSFLRYNDIQIQKNCFRRSFRITNNMTIRNIRIPAKTYTLRELHNWFKQEWLNNALWYSVASNKSIQKIAALIKAGANINHRYNTTDGFDGETALHRAAAIANISIIHLLLRYSAAVNQKNKRGSTPLDWVIMRYHDIKQYCSIDTIEKQAQCREVIALLQQHGAQHNQKDFDAIIL